MRTEYVGVVGGMKTWNVYNDDGEIVGMNQAMPVVVPETITAVQIRKWLVAHGITLDSVDAAIAALPEDVRDNTKIEWEYNTEIRRSSSMLAQMAAGFGMDSDAIDQAFIEAAGL